MGSGIRRIHPNPTDLWGPTVAAFFKEKIRPHNGVYDGSRVWKCNVINIWRCLIKC